MITNFDPASLDKNKDGYISKTEIPQPLQGRFKSMFDRAGTERIAVDVLKRYLSYSQSSATPQGKDSAKTKMQGPTAGRTKKPAAGNSAGSFFERLDRNNDEQLTGEEIPQRMKQALRRFDSNGDRALSKTEFAKISKAMQQLGDNQK